MKQHYIARRAPTPRLPHRKLWRISSDTRPACWQPCAGTGVAGGVARDVDTDAHRFRTGPTAR